MEWISRDERLPMIKNVSYLTYWSDNTQEVVPYSDYYADIWNGSMQSNALLLFWQPLPEPPKEKEAISALILSELAES